MIALSYILSQFFKINLVELKKFKKYAHELMLDKNSGEPQYVSNLCVFLSTDCAKIISGSNFVIDGGDTNVI